MIVKLPNALASPENYEKAVDLVRGYYEGVTTGSAQFEGSHFDVLDGGGGRRSAENVLESADVVALTFLQVPLATKTAYDVLVRYKSELEDLLALIPSDLDLVDMDPARITEDWPAWRLYKRLQLIDGISYVRASKLLARKRPRLIPVRDRHLDKLIDGDFWAPLCRLLKESAPGTTVSLHERLVAIGADAGVPAQVSALRIFDVIAWREGTQR